MGVAITSALRQGEINAVVQGSWIRLGGVIYGLFCFFLFDLNGEFKDEVQRLIN